MSELNYRTRFNHLTEEFFSSSGSPLKPEYIDSIDEDGVPCVKEIGQINTDDFIQASFEQCSIYNILERCTSDPSLLEKVKGDYISVLDAPVSLADALNRKIEMENSFNKLPLHVRQAFDNNLHNLINSLSDGSAEVKINDVLKDKFNKAEPKAEPKADPKPKGDK